MDLRSEHTSGRAIPLEPLQIVGAAAGVVVNNGCSIRVIGFNPEEIRCRRLSGSDPEGAGKHTPNECISHILIDSLENNLNSRPRIPKLIGYPNESSDKLFNRNMISTPGETLQHWPPDCFIEANACS